ncbi:MAG: hypothetical protein FWF29_04065 [Treponema sp.]|nr:hypothetical protein [Treponema sp.]
MKRILVILLLLPASVFAQNKLFLNHFWDIPWGVSIEQAESVYNDRGLESVRNGNCLITHAKYEREDATIMLLFNKMNRFYCGNVIYPSSAGTVLSKYDSYRKVLFRRYGMPDTSVEYFSGPYKKGDGREVEAIQTENAFYFTEWEFSDDCRASVSILKNTDICLTFKNPAYADATAEKN